MDFKVSMKEERLQPDGAASSYVPDVFDLFLELDEDGETILDVSTYEDLEETEQSALFASIRQRGSDPLNPDLGVMWAECLIGEITPNILITQIMQAVHEVAPGCSVEFIPETTPQGHPMLSFEIKVMA